MTALEATKFNCLRNAYYHEDREHFFASAERWSQMLNLTFGTAAIAAAFDAMPAYLKDFAYGTSSILAVLATLSSVIFNWQKRAARHSELRRKFFELQEAAYGKNVNQEQIDRSLQAIYKTEDAAFIVVDAMAYNRASETMGRSRADMLIVSTFNRMTRHLFRRAHKQFSSFREADKSAMPKNSGA